MKLLQWLPAGLFLISLPATIVGQTLPALPAYPPDGPIAARMISSSSFGGGASHGVYSVKGSPFSADVVYEFTQSLGDGNSIHRESHGKVFRDAEGRIRNEMDEEKLSGRITMQQITIQDPVTETFVTLSPQTMPKTAVINHMMVVTDAAGHRLGVGFAADSSQANSSPPTGTRSPAELLEQLKALQQLQRPMSGDQPIPRTSRVPGTPAEQKPLRSRLGEELGAKEIEGFTASGIRHSSTIPAGDIGNEKPLVTTNEVWWCEDLKAVLVSVYDDPQSGRRVMRLTNIQVGEPDSQLFQIPPDYTVREYPQSFKTVAKPPQ